jgi:hypothetical protein
VSRLEEVVCVKNSLRSDETLLELDQEIGIG